MKYIFVDLDNTLIAADYLVGSPPRNAVVVKFKIDEDLYDNYYARVKIGSDKFLSELRKIAPTYMLTAASKDYANSWNDAFNFGFKPDEIYSREDTAAGNKLKLQPGKCFLIDDLPITNSRTKSKIDFLSDIGSVELINIKPFYGFDNQAFTDSKILEIINQIK